MDAVAGSSARVVVVTSGISARVAGAGGHAKEDEQDEADQESEEEAQGRDPHVWLSVDNARTMVAAIRDALAAADPENAPLYRDLADLYLTSLSQLDAAIRQEVAAVPEGCRKLVTNHDTLGYFATSYGFTIVGSVIPSVDSEARPSASDVADIVRRIREEKVPAIFAETSINPALINQVGREAGVKVVSDLYGDSLGPKGSDGETYIKMMEANTKKIVDALGRCNA
jgi:ABC-type Zn uptake system ZnuABC Zn-binding protein ZnuA